MSALNSWIISKLLSEEEPKVMVLSTDGKLANEILEEVCDYLGPFVQNIRRLPDCREAHVCNSTLLAIGKFDPENVCGLRCNILFVQEELLEDEDVFKGTILPFLTCRRVDDMAWRPELYFFSKHKTLVDKHIK